MGSGMTGKLDRAWVGAWVGDGLVHGSVHGSVHGCMVVLAWRCVVGGG